MRRLGLSFCFCWLATSLTITADDTPLSDRSADHTGRAPGLHLPTGEVGWKYISEVDNEASSLPGISDPAAANGMLFFGDDLGVVRAVTAKHGKQIWQHEHGERVFHRPTCNGNTLVFTTRRGVTALEVGTGFLSWHIPIENGTGRCALHGNQVFFAGSDGFSYAVDSATGKVIWKSTYMKDVPPDPPRFDGQQARFPNTAARPSGIATDGQQVFHTIFDQCRLVAVDAKTGEVNWAFQSKGWTYGDPAVDESQVYFGSQDKHLYCLNKATGRVMWKAATGARIESGPAVGKSLVYVPSCDGYVYAYNKRTGAPTWKFATEKLPGAIYSAPILGDKLLYFAAAEGHVYAVDAETGDLAWKVVPARGSNLYCTLATDGTRLFAKSRPDKDLGINSIIAIGPDADQ